MSTSTARLSNHAIAGPEHRSPQILFGDDEPGRIRDRLERRQHPRSAIIQTVNDAGFAQRGPHGRKRALAQRTLKRSAVSARCRSVLRKTPFRPGAEPTASPLFGWSWPGLNVGKKETAPDRSRTAEPDDLAPAVPKHERHDEVHGHPATSRIVVEINHCHCPAVERVRAAAWTTGSSAEEGRGPRGAPGDGGPATAPAVGRNAIPAVHPALGVSPPAGSSGWERKPALRRVARGFDYPAAVSQALLRQRRMLSTLRLAIAASSSRADWRMRAFCSLKK